MKRNEVKLGQKVFVKDIKTQKFDTTQVGEIMCMQAGGHLNPKYLYLTVRFGDGSEVTKWCGSLMEAE